MLSVVGPGGSHTRGNSPLTKERGHYRNSTMLFCLHEVFDLKVTVRRAAIVLTCTRFGGVVEVWHVRFGLVSVVAVQTAVVRDHWHRHLAWWLVQQLATCCVEVCCGTLRLTVRPAAWRSGSAGRPCGRCWVRGRASGVVQLRLVKRINLVLILAGCKAEWTRVIDPGV